MKKIICVLLAAFMLFLTPVRGYAAGVEGVVWGITEEYILAFLASLLGVQAVGAIDTSEQLRAYNNELYDGLLDTLAGYSTVQELTAWLMNAVAGSIDTNSVIWQKFYELCIGNYVAATGSGTNVDHSSGIGTFQFTMYQNTLLNSMVNAGAGSFAKVYSDAFVDLGNKTYLFASSNNVPYHVDHYYENELSSTYYPTSVGSYTYNGLTVYYAQHQFSGTMSPVTTVYDGSKPYRWMEKISWLMVYGGYEAVAIGDAVFSDAFAEVLTDSEKDDIIDGTSVIQLYNPADVQNGLHIVPDPEDPDNFEIPYVFTADWYNFFKQFGSSAADAYVEAYNAINGLVGAGTGSVSDLYNKLGVASLLNTSADAAQGVAALTSENIYPYNLTANDAISNTIPGSLTPQTPDSGIDNESPQGLYKLPDLRDYFPFCIPFDLIDLLSCFVAEPETPEFVIALSTGWAYADETVSLDQWNGIAQMVRNVELAVFILALILMTRNLIRG